MRLGRIISNFVEYFMSSPLFIQVLTALTVAIGFIMVVFISVNMFDDYKKIHKKKEKKHGERKSS